MKKSSHSVLMCMSVCFSLLILPAFDSAQPQCLTNADADCDMTVNVTELVDHINDCYQCSSCVPDIFNALQAYFVIPFCGDWDCNADEDNKNCGYGC